MTFKQFRLGRAPSNHQRKDWVATVIEIKTGTPSHIWEKVSIAANHDRVKTNMQSVT